MTIQAWLALSKGAEDYRRQVKGEHYDDHCESHYSWDSTVPNHEDVKVGDLVAFWDSDVLLGISVIEHIQVGTAKKTVGKCPQCGKSSFEARKTMKPTYRCYDCDALFDGPALMDKEVTTYRSNHEESWIDLDGVIDAATLRSLCVYPKSQNSFRLLRLEDFRAVVEAKSGHSPLRILDAVSDQIAGGHKERVVRVRVGQAAFRAELRKRYVDVCAFTGPAPAVVLDACHLYRYAEVGAHRDQGGLLLRKDLHRLFDEGLVCVDSEDVLFVSEEIREYTAYKALHGSVVEVDLTAKQRSWLREHWEQWRQGDIGVANL